MMRALQGQAAERARADALEARLQQQAGELAALRAQLEEAQKPKVRAPPALHGC